MPPAACGDLGRRVAQPALLSAFQTGASLVAELQRVDPAAPELFTPGGEDKLPSLGNQDLADWLGDLGTATAGRFTGS